MKKVLVELMSDIFSVKCCSACASLIKSANVLSSCKGYTEDKKIAMYSSNMCTHFVLESKDICHRTNMFISLVLFYVNFS